MGKVKGEKAKVRMKDSGIEWIGEIPEEVKGENGKVKGDKLPDGWEVKKIKYVCDIQTGNSIKDEEKDYYTDENDAIPYISSKDIDSNFFTINYANGLYTKISDSSFKIAKKGSTLMCIEGGSAGKKKAFLDRNVSFVNKLCCFTPIDINEKYLFFSLCNPMFEDEFFKYITGMIGGVSQKQLKNFCVCFPPLSEQQTIADFLDAKCSEIDSLSADIQAQIETLQAYKRSVITEAVTGKLGSEKGEGEKGKGKGKGKGKVRMKDSGIEWIGEIPEGWEVKRGKYIADSISKGNGITKEQVFDDGDIQCVRYGEIYSKYSIAFHATYSRTKSDSINSKKYIYYGDILFAGTGELIEEIGKNIVYLGNEPCLAGGDIIVMHHSQNPIFLNYAFNSAYAQKQKSENKAKLKVVHINGTDIGNIRIALPPMSEQQTIADFLDTKCSEIDSIIAQKREQLLVLADYKKSIIYEYVTGKKQIEN